MYCILLVACIIVLVTHGHTNNKFFFCVFVKGMVLVDLFICGETLSAECYCGTLKRFLFINSTQNLALLQQRVVILHDDTRALPLSNFELFVPIRKQKYRKRLQEDADLKRTLTS